MTSVSEAIQGDSGEEINILAGYSIGNCRGKSRHMNMCLILKVTERGLFASPDITPLDFFYKIKVETQGEFLARNLMINSDEQPPTFARDLQSTLWLTVGVSSIDCEL